MQNRLHEYGGKKHENFISRLLVRPLEAYRVAIWGFIRNPQAVLLLAACPTPKSDRLLGACDLVRVLVWFAAFGVAAGCATTAPDALSPYRVEGDAIPGPLVPAPGDAARGRDVLLGRDGNCLLCHAVPEAGGRFMGNLALPLSGVGARLSAGQLRLRIVDSTRLSRNTIMPSYYRVDGLNKVAAAWRGRPVLTAQQVEDTIAYLLTLR
jgi:sulfur-oxidizing protein SoxX